MDDNTNSIYSKEYGKKYSINPTLTVRNQHDDNGNPTGGEVASEGLDIRWQDGPRGQADGTLAEPNGAFVEDVIYSAIQRLDFFQQSKFKHDANAKAIECLQGALDALASRSEERKATGKLGTHEV